MRRLPRILLNAATATSLVLCVTAVELWVRSYWLGGSLDWQGNQNDSTTLYWARGRLSIIVQRNALTPAYMAKTNYRFDPPHPIRYLPCKVDRFVREWPDDLSAWWARDLAKTTTTDVGWAGVRYRAGKLGGTQWLRQWVVPLWAIAGLLGALGWALLRVRTRLARHERRAAGLCPACGYDLRATPGRCPECGTIPAR